MLREVMPLDNEHYEGIELLMAIDESQKIAWISLCKDLLTR